MVTVERVHRLRGKVIHRQFVISFGDYYPIRIMDSIRDDTEAMNIPRVMLNMDAIYGNMNKSGRVQVAQQHKFTAPRTRIEYWLVFSN